MTNRIKLQNKNQAGLAWESANNDNHYKQLARLEPLGSKQQPFGLKQQSYSHQYGYYDETLLRLHPHRSDPTRRKLNPNADPNKIVDYIDEPLEFERRKALNQRSKSENYIRPKPIKVRKAPIFVAPSPPKSKPKTKLVYEPSPPPKPKKKPVYEPPPLKLKTNSVTKPVDFDESNKKAKEDLKKKEKNKNKKSKSIEKTQLVQTIISTYDEDILPILTMSDASLNNGEKNMTIITTYDEDDLPPPEIIPVRTRIRPFTRILKRVESEQSIITPDPEPVIIQNAPSTWFVEPHLPPSVSPLKLQQDLKRRKSKIPILKQQQQRVINQQSIRADKSVEIVEPLQQQRIMEPVPPPKIEPHLLSSSSHPPETQDKPEKPEKNAKNIPDELPEKLLDKKDLFNKYLNSPKKKTHIISFGKWGTFTYDAEPQSIQPPTPQIQNSPTKSPQESENKKQQKKKVKFDTHSLLSREVCHEELIKWASRGRQKKLAQKCQVLKVTSFNSLEYTLETFGETRSIICAYRPHKQGEKLSLLNPDLYNDPWEIKYEPKAKFQNETKMINIPFTDVLGACFMCSGMQWIKCSKCKGKGNLLCTDCHGKKTFIASTTDQKQLATCGTCFGKGYINCEQCQTKGRIICNVCEGHDQLVWFLQLNLEFINHIDKYAASGIRMPMNIRDKVVNEIIMKETGMQLSPVRDCENLEIVEISKDLIRKSKEAYKNERRRLQQHYISGLTCYECQAEYKKTFFKFWIYGTKRQIYCSDFPDDPVLRCSIL